MALEEQIRGLSPGALDIVRKQVRLHPELYRNTALEQFASQPISQPIEQEQPWWQTPLSWIRNVEVGAGTLLASPFTPQVAGTEGMSWWERERAEYEAWDEPSFQVEPLFRLPWTPEEIREYIHVEDAARCSVEILDNNFVNQNVLLTGHHPIKSRDMVTMINEMLGNKLTIEFRHERPDAHYEVTPYSYNPRLGKKYVSHYYIDMGQGLLQCIEEVHQKVSRGEM